MRGGTESKPIQFVPPVTSAQVDVIVRYSEASLQLSPIRIFVFVFHLTYVRLWIRRRNIFSKVCNSPRKDTQEDFHSKRTVEPTLEPKVAINAHKKTFFYHGRQRNGIAKVTYRFLGVEMHHSFIFFKTVSFKGRKLFESLNFTLYLCT